MLPKGSIVVLSLKSKSIFIGGSMQQRLKIKMTQKRGRGVFANCKIKKGEIIEVAPVIVLSRKEAKAVNDLPLASHFYAWGRNGKQVALVLGFGCFYNHSYNPNANYSHRVQNQAIVFRALKDIAPGEEITHNYGGSPESKELIWFTKNNWGFVPTQRKK